MAVPICPLCGTQMYFCWEPFIHDSTLRAVAKAGLIVPLAVLAWERWAHGSFSFGNVLLAWIAMLLSVAALTSRPVVRCDGCAYTTAAS